MPLCRAAVQKEREERRAAAYSDVKVKAEKLSAARQVMADHFPSRETDMGVVQETEMEVEEAPIEQEEEEEEEEQEEEELPLPPAVKLLRPEDVDPLSAARERLADAFPGSDTAQEVDVPAAAKPKTAAKKKTPAATRKKAAAAAAAPKKKKQAAPKKAAAPVTMEMKEEVEPKAPKKSKAAAAGRKKSTASAPTMQNGNALNEQALPAAAAPTPDDYDDLSEDLSRALRGVQGYDLDALDLEMDDLRPEDLEVCVCVCVCA